MSTNNIFRPFVKILFAFSLLQMSSIAVKANEVSLGDFNGTLTTTVSSGLALRMEAADCRLISGDSLDPDGAGVEDRSATVGYVGHYADNGNGGCNTYETDSYGNTSSKTISRKCLFKTFSCIFYIIFSQYQSIYYQRPSNKKIT